MEEIRNDPRVGVPRCVCGRAPKMAFHAGLWALDCWECKIGTSGHDEIEDAEDEWRGTIEEKIFFDKMESGVDIVVEGLRDVVSSPASGM